MSNTDKPDIMVENTKVDRYDYFIDICIKGANQLRNYLHIDENGYRYVAGIGHSKAKEYYIYGILDEIERSGIFLIDLKDFLQGEDLTDDKNQEDSRIRRNIYKSRLDEAALWSRKLSEILVEVLLFMTTNSENYYKHYLLLNKLSKVKQLLLEFRNYHNCDNENLKYQQKDLEQELSAVTSNLIVSKVWYAHIKNGQILNSKVNNFKDTYNRALPNMRKAQRHLIGDSYLQFAKLSTSLHPDFIDPNYRINMKYIEAHFGHIALLAGHILSELKVLMNKRPGGFIGQLSKILKEIEKENPLFKQKKILRGDYVIAYSDLAKVIKINKSSYGNITYRVKYLEKEPLPNILEDEFPAKYVHLYCAQRTILTKVKGLIGSEKPNIKLKNSELEKAIDKSIVHFWEDLGDKHRVSGRPDLHMKRIEEYIANNQIEKI